MADVQDPPYTEADVDRLEQYQRKKAAAAAMLHGDADYHVLSAVHKAETSLLGLGPMGRRLLASRLADVAGYERSDDERGDFVGRVVDALKAL